MVSSFSRVTDTNQFSFLRKQKKNLPEDSTAEPLYCWCLSELFCLTQPSFLVGQEWRAAFSGFGA